jgi:hypothetical protein
MALFPIVRSLATNVTLPNINKVEVIDFDDRRDNIENPRIEIELHFRGIGNRDAGTLTVVARDTQNSTRVFVNASPSGYGDVILIGTAQIDGACTALAAAYDAALASATGTRNAKLATAINAAVVEAQNIGLIGPGLTSST